MISYHDRITSAGIEKMDTKSSGSFFFDNI